MKTHNLGYPRIGNKRELKKACEKYWSGIISQDELLKTAKFIRKTNWELQKKIGIDLIPVNDFSFYDHVLDMSLLLGVIPDRYMSISQSKSNLDLYFAMARGYQKEIFDLKAMEMTKWFNTNYHYIVPEFKKNQSFHITNKKIFQELQEAKNLGINPKPVLIGPVSYLLLGKEKEKNFFKIDLIKNLLPIYIQVLKKIKVSGVEWVQIDEPFLSTDLTDKELNIFKNVYNEINKEIPDLKILLTSYFDSYGDNLKTVLSLPVNGLHLDLVNDSNELENILSNGIINNKILSLGLIDGRNIWKNDLKNSLKIVKKALLKINLQQIWISPSCSLLHSPCDLDSEEQINIKIKNWLAFSKQKLVEVVVLSRILKNETSSIELKKFLQENREAIEDKKTSNLIHNFSVKKRLKSIKEKDYNRNSKFEIRQKVQKNTLKLPLFPTTTIGSFPQTQKVRSLRSKFKKGEITRSEYENSLKKEIIRAIHWQEDIGLDVLVHGEFERNDMVEYFGELLNGFIFTSNGWVQSYGSRCVKPPIIYGDVFRSQDISVHWSSFAQKQTKKLMKGMLTGPVTILQWSFVRNDQLLSVTAHQIALAIRDEVLALEKSGIKIIQIDEPALREGFPLKKKNWKIYLDWAVKCFRLSSSVVQDQTQIHTHMCYSEFNDIIKYIADLDADVITIEASRSSMELLNAFIDFKYPNEIGPGVYDIHSPRVPSVEEMVDLLSKLKKFFSVKNIWVNPDCGLKTRNWSEVKVALTNMVNAAVIMRKS